LRDDCSVAVSPAAMPPRHASPRPAQDGQHVACVPKSAAHTYPHPRHGDAQPQYHHGHEGWGRAVLKARPRVAPTRRRPQAQVRLSDRRDSRGRRPMRRPLSPGRRCVRSLLPGRGSKASGADETGQHDVYMSSHLEAARRGQRPRQARTPGPGARSPAGGYSALRPAVRTQREGPSPNDDPTIQSHSPAHAPQVRPSRVQSLHGVDEEEHPE
jgi:hypothetical protein